MPASEYFRTAIVITNLSASGAERVALNSAEMLASRGHRVDLILLENTIQQPVPASLPVHCLTENRKPLKALGGIGDRLLAGKLKQLIRQLEDNDQPFELILSHLPAADRVVALSKLHNVWFCIHTHYSAELAGFRQRGRPLRALRKKRQYRSYYRDRQLVTVSDGIQDDLREQLHIQTRRMQTIYNPFDFDKIRRLASLPCPQLPQTDFILHASAFRPVKRHDILLQAFARLKQPVKLLLLTDPDPALEKLIDKLDAGHSVSILGHQENPYPFMQQARLCVLSSEREGLPTAVIESLICGTPVVSTDCPSGPREILTGELANWLVPVNDPAALAEKIDQALGAEICIHEAQLEKFRTESVYQKYCQLVRSGR